MATDVHIPGIGNVDKKWAIAAAAGMVGIVAVGWWRKRQAPPAVIPTEDTGSGFNYGGSDPAGPGGVPYDPGSPASPQIPPPQNPGILTNLDWLSTASSLDLGGVAADTISRACSKVLGGVAVTQAEAEIFHEVTGIIGYPPQGYPAIKLVTSGPHPTASTYEYRVERHQISVVTGARDLVRRFSDAAVVTDTRIEVALRSTVADSRNAKYLTYYKQHNGRYPAQAEIYTHVVKKKG